MFFRTALAAFLAVGVSAPVSVAAPKMGVAVASSGNFLVLAQVTGNNVTEIGYPGGYFRKIGKRRWVESSPETTFEFVEEARGETTVMLYDASRDVYIQIDIANMEVLYGEGGDNRFRPLYRITRLEVAGAPPSAGGGAKVAANCRSVGKLRSQNSDVPVSVTFRNKTNSMRSVMWINFEGQPENYANLQPGQKIKIDTYVTHPWMMTDGPGNCAEVFMPKRGVERFDITAANPGGGD